MSSHTQVLENLAKLLFQADATLSLTKKSYSFELSLKAPDGTGLSTDTQLTAEDLLSNLEILLTGDEALWLSEEV
jgi:hypothetical protein